MDKHSNPAAPSFSQIFGETRTRKEVIALLESMPESYSTFQRLKPSIQEQLLAFLQGKEGLRITYNQPFLHIFNPDAHPERLESLLEALIGQPVTIRQVLPNEGERLAEHGSLVIMDIIAELADGSIVDVEMQKIGYLFPGQRSSCYVSDMIMRQYNRIRNERKKDFSYSDLKPVYLIILMEQSPEEFHPYPYAYIHRRVTSYTSGIQLPELANIIYISLDTFRSIVQNVSTELDAWLTFLSSTESSRILDLIQKYPKFLDLYKDMALFRSNPKELIFMFSEALYILDRNTEKYMVEEQNRKIKEQEKIIAANEKQIAKNAKQIAESQKQIAESQKQIAESQKQHAEDQKRIAELEEQLRQLQG